MDAVLDGQGEGGDEPAGGFLHAVGKITHEVEVAGRPRPGGDPGARQQSAAQYETPGVRQAADAAQHGFEQVVPDHSRQRLAAAAGLFLELVEDGRSRRPPFGGRVQPAGVQVRPAVVQGELRPAG